MSQRSGLSCPTSLVSWRPVGMVLAWLVMAPACGLALAAESAKTGFPPHFLMGTAVAGFQIEMGCPHLAAEICEDRHSDWYEFITSPWTRFDPLLFMSRQPPSTGPGFYELFSQDLDLARHALGSNAVRLSLEWSRIFPTPTFGVSGYQQLHQLASPTALEYYHRIFADMKRLGLRPMVTVNHYSLPNWIHDGVGCHRDFAHCQRRGWDDPKTIVPEIAKFAGFVAHEFGSEVDDWLTLNEPFAAVVLPSFLFPSPSRSNPPGVVLQIEAAKRATEAMIVAHARMYDAIHAEDHWSADASGVHARVGLASVLLAVSPASESAADRQAAANMRYIFNDLFLNAIATGFIDVAWDGHAILRPDLAGRLDFIGINYYERVTSGALGFTVLPQLSPLMNFVPRAYDDRSPESLYQVLKETSRYGLPMIVTETGVDHAGDTNRSLGWIKGTLGAVGRATAEGLPVGGYFYWSLMDNYEWNHGMQQRFGFFAVDPLDPEKLRTARPAVDLFHAFALDQLFPAFEASR